jgi:hypothetical protein
MQHTICNMLHMIDGSQACQRPMGLRGKRWGTVKEILPDLLNIATEQVTFDKSLI